jgi:hypothetical protein
MDYTGPLTVDTFKVDLPGIEIRCLYYFLGKGDINVTEEIIIPCYLLSSSNSHNSSIIAGSLEEIKLKIDIFTDIVLYLETFEKIAKPILFPVMRPFPKGKYYLFCISYFSSEVRITKVLDPPPSRKDRLRLRAIKAIRRSLRMSYLGCERGIRPQQPAGRGFSPWRLFPRKSVCFEVDSGAVEV